MTRSRRKQRSSSIVQQPSVTASRRLRQKTRRDYHESSDVSSPLPVNNSQTQLIVSSQESASSEFAVKAILDQRCNSSDEVEYLIDWADDPKTGQRYTPSWEPRTNVSAGLEAAWLRKRQSLPQFSSDSDSQQEADQPLVDAQKVAASSSPIIRHNNQLPSTKNRQRADLRRKFVVESSSPSSLQRSTFQSNPETNSTPPQLQPEDTAVAKRRAHYLSRDRSDKAENSHLEKFETVQPRTNSPSINHSADYQSARSARSDSSGGEPLAAFDRRQEGQRTRLSAQLSPRRPHVASGLAREGNSDLAGLRSFVAQSGANSSRAVAKPSRRFSTIAVIPDSQDSRESLFAGRSGSEQARYPRYIEQSNFSIVNQDPLESVCTTEHLRLRSRAGALESLGPVVPETPFSATISHQPVSEDKEVQQPAIAQHILDPNQSSTQSGYLASSEDEGFGGSEADESSVRHDSIPEGQKLEYSSLELSQSQSPNHSQVEHLSQADSFIGELQHLPQSTDPHLLNQDSQRIMATQIPAEEMGVDESISQPQAVSETPSGAVAPASTNTRSTRNTRNGQSNNDDGEAPATRKSLRGLRKEAENKRAEIKARTQKPTETNTDTLDVKQRSPESETQSSTGASRGRGRKKKDAHGDQAAANATAKINGATASNGEIAVKPVTQQVSLGPELPDMQFIVPMPLVSQAGDQYRRTVVYNKVLIENFTASHDPTPDLVSDAGQFVQTMRDICMHLDLANEEESLENVLPSQQMTWDRSISSKFQLMSILITRLQEQDLNVVIFAAPGKHIEVVEKFVRGHDVNLVHAAADMQVRSTIAERLLNVHLVPSKGMAHTLLEEQKADLIIALDHSMDVSSPSIRNLREKDSRLAPLIFLTVLNSIDHIDRVMASSWKGAARLQTEVACIARLRMEAGKLNDDYQSVADVGELIAQFVIDHGAEADWPVVPIGPLADNESWDLAMGHTVLRNNENESPRKRSQGSAVDSEARTLKRTRRSTSAANAQSLDGLPNVSEADVLRRLGEQSEQYIKAQDVLKEQLKDLKATMKKKDAHVRMLEKDFDKQMNRFEGQTRELEAMRKELDEANEKITQIRELKNRRDETIMTLREELGELRNGLTEASKLLENGTIPEVAELARLQREKEEAVAALDKAIKQAESAQKLSGYLQDQYRKASDQAVDAVEQTDILEARVKDLERKASGEAVRLQEASSDMRQKMTMDELERLKVELKNVKAVLAKKEEELKAKRSGIGTRAGSVPRSPRVGPASRATSPIPDRRIENLRNNTFTGRGKAKNPRKTLDAEDAAIAKAMAKQKKDTAQSPKSAAKSGDGTEGLKDGEIADLESKPASQEGPNGVEKLPDIQPTPTKSSGNEAKNGPPTSRPFPCTFAQYNCNASFTSKNEWKRHISTKHIQIGFWRCDMCNPSPGLDHPVFNDFNRKDLFTQHLRRMHAPTVPSQPSTPNPGVPQIREDSSAISLSQSGSVGVLTEEQIQEIVKRCFRILRQPPQVSSCLFCNRIFSGTNSWEERLEHVGGHMERDRKNGTNCQDISSWREDPELRQYLVTEGIVEQDTRGNWRIGDGRPRRSTDIQMPSTPAGASASNSQTPGAGGLEPESDGSMSRRRRGRPPKRPADYEHPPRAAPILTAPPHNQAGYADVRPRLDHSLQPQHPTSDLRGPMDSNSSTPMSARAPSGSHPRLEPYPQSQHNPQIHPSLQGQPYPPHSMSQQSPYVRDSSPPQQRGQLLPHIMPRTPSNLPGQQPQLSPLGGAQSPGGFSGQYSQAYQTPQGSQGVPSHNLSSLQQQAIAAAAAIENTPSAQSGASSRTAQAPTAQSAQSYQTAPGASAADSALHNHNLHLVQQHLDAQAEQQQERPPSVGASPNDLSAAPRGFHHVINERDEQQR